MRLIRQASKNDEFRRLGAHLVERSVFSWPLTEQGESYYQATSQADCLNLSFMIEHNGRALIVFACNLSKGALNWFGGPAQILLDKEAEGNLADLALRECVGELKRLTSAHGVESVEVLTPSFGEEPSLLAGTLISAQFEPEVRVFAIKALTGGEDKFLADMRKGHRQQVRWGRENLVARLVNCSRPDRGDFDAYRALHAEAAGRITRGEASWNAMYETIASGYGRLVLVTLQDELVGGTLILDSLDTAFYASGAYKREYFEMPLGHYSLFLAMRQSAQENRRWFNFGDVSMTARMSDKERSIAYFKRGFSSSLRVAVNWRWNGGGSEGIARI